MKQLSALVLCLLLSGCYIGQGRFPIVSNQDMNLADLTIDKQPVAPRQQATSVSFSLFDMQFASGGTLDQSMDKVLGRNEAEVLKDAHFKTIIIFIPFFTTLVSWEVSGTPYAIQE